MAEQESLLALVTKGVAPEKEVVRWHFPKEETKARTRKLGKVPVVAPGLWD